MTDFAISAGNVGKQYRIQHEQGQLRYFTLRDALAGLARRSITAISRGGAGSDEGPQSIELFWALREVSFNLDRGEVVGIIGRNGSGKSTLLKILSRITPPTEGKVRLRGTVSSLLEVGTGFHPELTGRENVFLNGAILGMTRAETARRFDEIVAFAEVERFLDTPVKRYSSGMAMRLAFAVAAHLEPDILIVDEVLAVGDAEFQKKCLGRMDGVTSRGRTVLFVSHQMNQIRRLCRRCIWLQDGRVMMDGPTSVVTGAYEAASMGTGSDANHYNVRILDWRIVDGSDHSHVLESDGPVTVRFRVQSTMTLRIGHHSIALMNEDRIAWGMEIQNFELDPGTQELVYSFPSLPLSPGAYTWRLVFYDHRGVLDSFDCRPNFVVGTAPAIYARPEWTGLLNVQCLYSRVRVEADEMAPAGQLE
jgi:ABC-type polysaccharide/polyol phosphate transport system ATPase subunit